MADRNVEDIIAGVENIGLEERERVGGEKEGRSKELNVVDEGKLVELIDSCECLEKEVEGMLTLNAVTGDNKSSVVTTPTPSRGRRRRVDSLQESAKDNPAVELDLVQLQEELRQTKAELKEALARNDELLEEFENYKVRFNIDRTRAAECKTDKLQKDLEACREELKQVESKKLRLEQRDGPRQRFWEGRNFAYQQEDIHFYENLNRFDGVREVILGIAFKFPMRSFLSDGIWKETIDYGTIAYMRYEGHIYLSRSGKTRDNPEGFINSDHWTTEALKLAGRVGLPTIKRGYATHAEPQLMAFYITRMLEAEGHSLAQFGDPVTYHGRQHPAELVSIPIYVSMGVCQSCEDFVQGVNAVMGNYGYTFEPVDKSVET